MYNSSKKIPRPTCFGIVDIVFIDEDLVERYGSRPPHRMGQSGGEGKARHVGVGPCGTWTWRRDTERESRDKSTSDEQCAV